MKKQQSPYKCHLFICIRGAENLKVPQKNATAEYAEPRRMNPFNASAVFCDLLRVLRFLFVCLGGTIGSSSPLKSRNGEKKSCGDSVDPKFKSMLKDEIKDRGWKGLVRVSESSCLGVCATGPNIMIHPQNIWLSAVNRGDLPESLQIVDDLLED